MSKTIKSVCIITLFLLLCTSMMIPVKAAKINLKNGSMKISKELYSYNKRNRKPGVKVVVNGKVLKKNRDYKVTYVNAKGPGKAKVVVEGIGSYEGKLKKYYYILKKQGIRTPHTIYTNSLATYKIKLGAQATGDGTLTYESGDTSIAVVNSKGTVRFVKPGRVYIYITASQTGTYLSKKKKVKLIIKESTKQELSKLKATYAAKWAIKIANDDSFHYGKKPWACHHGCYYCGTNGVNSTKAKDGAPLDQALKSYCCNPFVTAAYCHGAGGVKLGTDVSTIINCKESKKRINLANDRNYALKDTTNFKEIEKPNAVTNLQVGDILLADSHALIYIGDGKVADAGGGDDGKENSNSWNNSIRTRDMPSYWWKKTKLIYRYIGG